MTEVFPQSCEEEAEYSAFSALEGLLSPNPKLAEQHVQRLRLTAINEDEEH